METGIKALPNRGTHYCFACSPINPAGLHMEFFTDDRSVFSSLVIPDHLCGWDNIVHGGIVSTILDEIMSWSAIYLLQNYILTKSITVDFLKPVFVGDQVRAVGQVGAQTGKREALMEGALYKEEDVLCARARGTFALINVQMARKLGIMNENTINSFAPIIDR